MEKLFLYGMSQGVVPVIHYIVKDSVRPLDFTAHPWFSLLSGRDFGVGRSFNLQSF
jgi:hypothetical protein